MGIEKANKHISEQMLEMIARNSFDYFSIIYTLMEGDWDKFIDCILEDAKQFITIILTSEDKKECH